jgi:hypothetical protein
MLDMDSLRDALLRWNHFAKVLLTRQAAESKHRSPMLIVTPSAFAHAPWLGCVGCVLPAVTHRHIAFSNFGKGAIHESLTLRGAM